MIKLNFTQRLGDLLLQIDCQLPAEGITAIFGLSGAGKTSLINVISGLTKPQTGSVYLHQRALFDREKGIFLPANKRRIGYVFQDARLFPHYRVDGNLKYGMLNSMAAQFEAIVALLGIERLLQRYPATLSGGEKQRVAIGRALLTAPDLLLMDEPLASLDAPRKRELMPYLERLSHEVNIPMLYVTHSLDEIVRLAQHVLVLDRGRVLACGALERVWASNALRPWFTEDDQKSILKVKLIKHHDHYSMSAVTLGQQTLWISYVDAALGSEISVQIDANDVSITLNPSVDSSIRNIIPAMIVDVMYKSAYMFVALSIDGSTIWAKISHWAYDELQLKLGQSVFAQIKSVSINR